MDYKRAWETWQGVESQLKKKKKQQTQNLDDWKGFY